MTIWHQRWSNQQIGFHRSVVNDLLEKHWPTLNVQHGGTVLVPLCGKSVDMHWLAQQEHDVIGVELVLPAAEAFFEEAGNTPEVESVGQFKRLNSGPNTILCGDFFSVPTSLASCTSWYDRAALVALPSSVRPAYVEQIRNLCKPGSVGLMITFAYPQEQMQGPPFSLPDEEVDRLFSTGFEIELLEQLELEDEKDRGISNLYSSVYKLTRR